MPRMRKVDEAEVLEEALRKSSRRGGTRLGLYPTDGVKLLDVLMVSGSERNLTQPPRVGDVVVLKASQGTPTEATTGVVLRVQIRRDGVWVKAELLMHNGIQWASKSTIDRIVGRPKGVSRIDQATRHLEHRTHGGTHGWFVRVYEGKKHKIARMFSDNRYGGSGEALRAALAFHSDSLRRAAEIDAAEAAKQAEESDT